MSGSADPLPSVAVAVVTYRRPDLLARLLGALPSLEWPRPSLGDLTVVVVDNDPEGSAAPVVESLAASLPWPVRYLLEPAPGIAAARNAAVAAAEDAEFVAFVDDDELPVPDWLVQLVRTQRATDADVVGGPVLPDGMDEMPVWMAAGSGFERRRFPTGIIFDPILRPAGSGPRPSLGSGNMLVRRDLTSVIDPLFDPAFGLTGGSDSLFVLRAEAAGRRIAWCDEAITSEPIPASRRNVGWILRRAQRVGNARTRAELAVACGGRSHVRRQALTRAATATAAGAARLAVSLVRGDRAGLLRAGRHFATAAGIVSALLGSVTTEYAR